MKNGIGDVLKSTRIQMGLTLSDVENATKIRSKYLAAIEEENFGVIPGQVYLKGFIKSYARYLNIDNNEEILKFLEDTKTPYFEVEIDNSVEEKSEMPKGIRKKYITIAMGILAILVLFGMQNIYDNFQKKEPVAPPNENNNESILPPITQEPSEPLETAENELPQNNKLIISVIDLTPTNKEACWMRIFSDDNLVYEGTMYEGEQKTIEAQEKIKIKFGNAGVVNLVLGETDLGIPGKVNHVLEKEFILSDYE